MINGWWFDYTDDISVLHPGILFHPMKWSVTSEGWKVHFACCIHCFWRLYTLLLGTRQQLSSTSSVRRGVGCCRPLFVYFVEMDAGIRQVASNMWQGARWPLTPACYYITCTQSYLFHRKLEHISCFLFCCLLDGGCPLQTIADLTIVISLGLFPLYLN